LPARTGQPVHHPRHHEGGPGHRPAPLAGDLCSGDVISIAPDDDIGEAASLMREAAVRRLPVIEAGRAVGIVSVGDRARTADPSSVLSDISDEPPDDRPLEDPLGAVGGKDTHGRRLSMGV
jgi:CBS domain-containing protein